MFFPVSVKDNPRAIAQIVSLMQARKKRGAQRLSDEQTEQMVQTFLGSLDDSRVHHLASITSTGEVASYMAQVITDASPNYWLMSFLLTNPGLDARWKYTENGLEVLWRLALGAGSKGYGRPGVVWSLPKAWSNTYARTQKSSRIWSSYHVTSYAEVPAGALPKHDFDRWVFGEQAKPYNVVLRYALPTKIAQGSEPERIWRYAESSPEPDSI